MKLSWSHRLFLKVNAQVGKRYWLDACMIFCAKQLIFVLAATVVVVDVFGYYAVRIPPAQGRILAWSPFVAVSACIAIVLSWILGFLWKHRRPIVELPEIKEIVKPLGTWKSFPSDHTILAFIFAFALWFMVGWNEFSAVVSVFGFIAATLVAMSRVYVGVHYPRDVLGGCIIGAWFGYYFVRIGSAILSFF